MSAEPEHVMHFTHYSCSFLGYIKALHAHHAFSYLQTSCDAYVEYHLQCLCQKKRTIFGHLFSCLPAWGLSVCKSVSWFARPPLLAHCSLFWALALHCVWMATTERQQQNQQQQRQQRRDSISSASASRIRRVAVRLSAGKHIHSRAYTCVCVCFTTYIMYYV